MVDRSWWKYPSQGPGSTSLEVEQALPLLEELENSRGHVLRTELWREIPFGFLSNPKKKSTSKSSEAFFSGFLSGCQSRKRLRNSSHTTLSILHFPTMQFTQRMTTNINQLPLGIELVLNWTVQHAFARCSLGSTFCSSVSFAKTSVPIHPIKRPSSFQDRLRPERELFLHFVYSNFQYDMYYGKMFISRRY